MMIMMMERRWGLDDIGYIHVQVQRCTCGVRWPGKGG